MPKKPGAQLREIPPEYWNPMDFDKLEAYNNAHNKDLIDGTKLDQRGPARVGMLNPFLFASIVLGETVAAGTPQAMEKIIKAINVYNRTVIADPNDLVVITSPKEAFDKTSSPLYQSVDTVKMIASVSMVAPVSQAVMSGSTKKFRGRLQVADWIKTIPGDETAEFAAAPPAIRTGIPISSMPDIHVGAAGMANPNIKKLPVERVGDPIPTCGTGTCPVIARQYTDRRDLVGDVVQGISVDCYFLAALYSVAWKYYQGFPSIPYDSVKKYYTITFYTYPDLKATPIPVLPTMPLAAGSVMVFAQESPEYELWSAMYEKAYAVFAKTTIPNNSIADLTVSGANASPPCRDVDTGTLPTGDPLTALTNITKLFYTFLSTNNNMNRPSAFLTETVRTGKNIWGKNSAAILKSWNNTGTGATNFATVAWTPDTAPANYGKYYDNIILALSHAYSVLGVTTINSVDYVILRNPWGIAIDINTVTSPLKDALGQNPWKPDTSALTIQLGTSPYSIFALKTDIFDQVFQGFGWAQYSKLTSI